MEYPFVPEGTLSFYEIIKMIIDVAPFFAYFLYVQSLILIVTLFLGYQALCLPSPSSYFSIVKKTMLFIGIFPVIFTLFFISTTIFIECPFEAIFPRSIGDHQFYITKYIIKIFSENCRIIWILTPHFLGSYFLGALPFGIFFSRLLNLPDPRTMGSRNIGATNVLRSGNKAAAIATLLADAVKGIIAIFIFYSLSIKYCKTDNLTLSPLIYMKMKEEIILCLGFFAVLGHIFPVWLNFKGGKGVATALGLFFVFFGFLWGLAFLGLWILVAWLFHYSSLASIITVCAAVPLGWLTYGVSGMPIFLITLIVVFRHKDNISRLLKGEENKIAFFTPKTT